MKNKISITEGSIWKGLLSFFFPILLGTFYQQLYNTVDAVIVGRFVGKEALAAVGGGTGIYVNLLVGFFVGLGSGAGVVISQFYGARNARETERSVHTSLCLSVLCAILIMVLGILTAKPVLTLMGTPTEIMDIALEYLQIFFCGMIPMVVYNMGAGILRAAGDSRSPFVILVIGCIINIVLDVLFVGVWNFGIEGAAWATVISQLISMILVLVVLYRSQDSIQFRFKKLCVVPHIAASIVRIGLPTGLQAVMYTVSNLIIQTSINTLGTDTIAACSAWGKIDSIFWMTINAFGVAMTTFAGQNFGAKNYERIKKGTMQCLLIASGATILLSVFFYFGGSLFFKMFTTDANVIAIGMDILKLVGPTFITYVSIEILSGTVRGAGSSTIPTILTFFGICLLRVVWIFTVVLVRHDILTIYFSYPLTWTITSIMFWIYYKKGNWLKQKKA